MISARATLKRATAVAAALALAGCGQPQNALTGGHGVAAADLDQTLVSNQALSDPKADKALAVGLIVKDSATKCGIFVQKLVATETGTDTTLDLLGAVFSALGTAFTPLSTVHAFSAAGSVVSGSKAAIDSDVYAKASVANFIQAIQSTYYADLGTYWSKFSAEDPASINLPWEVTKILSLHAECSLASAQAAISSTLQGGQTPASTTKPGAGAPPSAPPPPLPRPPGASPPAALAGAAPPPKHLESTEVFVPGHAIH
jgi:hypothetical protein